MQLGSERGSAGLSVSLWRHNPLIGEGSSEGTMRQLSKKMRGSVNELTQVHAS
jgi:hypothetical protein